MKRYKFNFIFLILVISAIGVFSCKDNQESKAATAIETIENMEEASQQDTLRIILNSNDKMQFDKTEITVFEGQTIILTLNHTGTMPLMAMGHNFVLLTKGVSISKFARAAAKAKKNNYIPNDKSMTIAHTGLIGGGESDTVTFKAPEKGTYDFLCSFPGHSAIMKGKFFVK